MFTLLIVKPIFNLLVLIYALLPGHNFGLAIILFTIVIRILMWPLLRKQLHNARVMRKLQPELKRIKQETKGDRQRESMLVMELYREQGVNPFSSIGILILQLPILIGLYAGLQRIISDPNNIVNFAYPALQNLGWMKELAIDISKLDQTLFGLIDLTRPALSDQGTYWPAMMLVLGSAVTQYYQSKQLMPNDQNARKLRHILREAGSSGKQADSAEVNAAVGRSTRYFIPVLIFFFTVNLASALALYWFVSGLVAMLQQAKILKEDEQEMGSGSRPKSYKKGGSTARVVSRAIEGEIIEKPKTPSKPKASTKNARKRRR